MGLIFDEQTLINSNIFKFENRLKSSTSRFIAEGAILTTYYQINEPRTTVDRGLQDIDQLFGKKSPLRFNQINNFPLYQFNQINVNNDAELQIEDISTDGECIILPSTIVPNPNDFFILNHLKMNAIFRVTEVSFDSMRVDGYYKIKYHLYSTSTDTINSLKQQTVGIFFTDLNSIGTEVNPIIKEDNFVLRGKIKQMVNKMIEGYRSLYYNERHNCFLYFNPKTRQRWFDMCGNEFIAKHNLLNIENANNVIMLSDKLRDSKLPLLYNSSIYNWIELDCPKEGLARFYFRLSYGCDYMTSSFFRWNERDVMVMHPLLNSEETAEVNELSYFDREQFDSLLGDISPYGDIEKLIYNFMNNKSISIYDIPLNIANGILYSLKNRDIFLYTPIIIYIIRKILRMN